ncbi:MAG TPA: methylenetetrahydrofolate reductase [Xanthobacteraceae bacterium]|nr:methylenetetrahydrofolate reductase [Xanthobacteraceae bacterium]
MTLKQRLSAGKFVLTAEVVPPISCDPQELMKKASPLKGVADAVNVTDGAGARAHMSAVAAATIMKNAGIEPILQLVCRDRNRIGLQSDLMGAAALGLENLLILGGDKPTAGDQPDAKAVFDLDSKSLSQTAKGIGEGVLPTGTKVTGAHPFFIGAADAPVDPKPDWQPTSLKGKVDAGAEFSQTQFCMDAGVIRRYVARLKDAGINLPMLVGVNPLRSAKSANWMRNNLFGTIIPDSMVERMEKAADPTAEGRAICVEYIEELSTIPGVAGVHVMAPGNDAAVPDVINAARAKIARAKF